MCDWEEYYKINLALLVGTQLPCNDADRSLFSPNRRSWFYSELLSPFLQKEMTVLRVTLVIFVKYSNTC